MRASTAAAAIISASAIALADNPGTPCSEVGNREFSDDFDVDENGVSDPGQVLFFGCFGRTFNHDDRDVVEPNNVALQVDALANRNERLFMPFIRDEAEMIFSVEDDRNIYYERERTGKFGLWTENVARVDVDGLEVHGDSNSDHHSFQGDPNGIALHYTGTLGISNVTTLQLLTGIQGMGLGLDIGLDDIDLDASMRWNEIDGGLLAFSLAPVFDDAGNVVLDGGEIFVIDLATLETEFLLHGGHLWDTAFDIMGEFGLDSENVNAIEVVPGPGPLATLALGGAILLRRRRR